MIDACVSPHDVAVMSDGKIVMVGLRPLRPEVGWPVGALNSCDWDRGGGDGSPDRGSPYRLARRAFGDG